jgi:hypothetical protein
MSGVPGKDSGCERTLKRRRRNSSTNLISGKVSRDFWSLIRELTDLFRGTGFRGCCATTGILRSGNQGVLTCSRTAITFDFRF